VLVQETPTLPTLALSATVKFPTGSERRGLGSGRTDYTVELLATKSVGPASEDKRTSVSVNLTHTFVGGGDDIFSPRANMEHPVNDKLTLVGELVGEMAKKNSLRSLVGAIYEISKNIALDIGVGFGLINADRAWSVTIGITYEFRVIDSLLAKLNGALR